MNKLSKELEVAKDISISDNESNFGKFSLFIIFSVVVLSILLTVSYLLNRGVSMTDMQNVTPKYLENLNERLKKKGNEEIITKLDVIIADQTVQNGLVNVSDMNTWLTIDSSGFSPREITLLKPQITAMRRLAKEDPEYCQIITEKKYCDELFKK